MLKQLRWAMAALVLTMAPAAIAQGTAAGDDAQLRDRVTITGTPEAVIRQFVDQIAVPSSKSQDQLARWDRRICPGVVGVKADFGRFLLDRLAKHALAVGLDVGAPGCKPNIVIYVTLKPDEVARELYERFGTRMGRFRERGVETQGRKALEAFVNSDAPVRWWHVANTITRDGQTLHQPANSQDGGPPMTYITGDASLITRLTHQDLASAFIIVDAEKTRTTDYGSLADYLAMVSLAQLDPSADVRGLPTILNLFVGARDGSATTAITEWDLGYLKGLYRVERESGSARRQESEIVGNMARELAQHDSKMN